MMRQLFIKDSQTGEEYTVPVDEQGAIDASHLRSIRVYDPAFSNTAVCRSSICWVDGERGELLYRGYKIEDLVANCSFLEVAFTLIYGHLPSIVEYQRWQKEVMTHTFTHVRLNDLMRSFNYDAHPMGMFISSYAAMSTFHPEANPALQVP
jgi:citrate synthase